MNRRSLLTIASIASLAVWHKPVINSVMLPAHAQTSCANILDVDVIGNWRFTSSDNVTFEIEFLDQDSWTDGSVTRPWLRAPDGQLALDIGIGPSLIAQITDESNCVASGLRILNENRFFTSFTPPATGVRF